MEDTGGGAGAAQGVRGCPVADRSVIPSSEESEGHQRQQQERPEQSGLTVVDWLLAQKSLENRSRAEIDAALREERDW